ncbi:MAG: hypothetical protein M0004_05425 [Actinomycetota bacterium]|nr:hypothetical protein [Actinomycetota bacterium]
MARAFHSWAAFVLFGVLVAAGWWRARSGRTGGGSRQLSASLATPVAGALAYLVALPTARAVGHPRPYQVLAHVVVLAHRSTSPGLPNAEAAMALGVAVALFMARDRLLGTLAVLGALAVAFNECYVGLAFPADAAAGLGLGLAVALVIVGITRPALAAGIVAIGRSSVGKRLTPTAAPSRNPLAPAAPAPAAGGSRSSSAGPAGRPVTLAATGAVRLLEDRPLSPRQAATDVPARGAVTFPKAPEHRAP